MSFMILLYDSADTCANYVQVHSALSNGLVLYLTRFIL